MKVGILTQPLKQNYGGIIQAYALFTFLKQMGHEVEVIDMSRNISKRNLVRICGSFVKRFIYRYILLNKNTPSPFHRTYMRPSEEKIMYKNTISFINKYIKKTEYITPVEDIEKLNNMGFDCFVVGSDQVWRPMYSPYLPHYFLDFCKNKENIKKIAYAASFGVAYNEYGKKMLNICRPLAQKFDAVSVREDSAKQLCHDLFGIKATHIIDPTLLLDAEHYTKLALNGNSVKNEGNLFVYVLDKNNNKNAIVKKITEKLSLKPFEISPKSNFCEVGSHRIDECIMPSIEQWLRGFIDADFVVTDSFHGCVFSIIFKRQFIAVGNAARGMARFTSLLKMFDIENRLIGEQTTNIDSLIFTKIDFEKVYLLLNKERKLANNFLIQALSAEQ